MSTFAQSQSAIYMHASSSGSARTASRLPKSALILVQLILLPFVAAWSQGHKQLPGSGPATTAQAPRASALDRDFGKQPLSFEANQGQSDPRVRFLSRGEGYSLFLTDREAVLALRKLSNGEGAPNSRSIPDKRASLNSETITKRSGSENGSGRSSTL